MYTVRVHLYKSVHLELFFRRGEHGIWEPAEAVLKSHNLQKVILVKLNNIIDESGFKNHFHIITFP